MSAVCLKGIPNSPSQFSESPSNFVVSPLQVLGPVCDGCKRDMHWTDADKDWSCRHHHRCRNDLASKGPERWCCRICQSDICGDCHPQGAQALNHLFGPLDQRLLRPFNPIDELKMLKMNFMIVVMFAPINPYGLIAQLLARLLDLHSRIWKLLMVRRRDSPMDNALAHASQKVFGQIILPFGAIWHVGLSLISFNVELYAYDRGQLVLYWALGSLCLAGLGVLFQVLGFKAYHWMYGSKPSLRGTVSSLGSSLDPTSLGMDKSQIIEDLDLRAEGAVEGDGKDDKVEPERISFESDRLDQGKMVCKHGGSRTDRVPVRRWFVAMRKAENGMASTTRVRLPAESAARKAAASPSGPSKSSSAGWVRKLSRTTSEADSNLVSTIMPHSSSSAQLSRMSEDELDEPEDLQSIVAQMEVLQAQQRSPQQPNPNLDAMIVQMIAGRPERRQRMAIMTKSALLRKKILSIVAPGGRALGCAVLGATHEWRRQPETFSDCNWPKASHSLHGIHHLPGGTAAHDRLLRCASDKETLHPLLESSEFYSFPRSKRFPGTKANGELDQEEVQKRAVPGPGAYMKSVPGGTAFSTDGGETVVLGANHTYPWKKALGRQINPIEADATTLSSAPCYTFSKTRKTVSDTTAGHGLQEMGGL
ncbi:unnamed protein product [Effrenium voratum]|nr:unnamed protein product [Effrenium voratum]